MYMYTEEKIYLLVKTIAIEVPGENRNLAILKHEIEHFKGELRSKISLLHMKVLTLIKAKSNVFFDTCNAVAAREDRKPKY